MRRSALQPFNLAEAKQPDAGAAPSGEQWNRFHQLLIDVTACADLESGFRLALAGILEVLGWAAAHVRWEIGGQPGTAWVVRQGEGPRMDKLGMALSRAPVASSAVAEGGRPTVLLDALASVPESRAREAARDAELTTYASLPVHADGRPVALLELFSATASPADGGGARTQVRMALELLAAQLSLVASRIRMREAVSRAAAHARRQGAVREGARPSGTGHVTESGNSGGGVSVRAADLYDERTGFPGRAILDDRIRQAVRRRQRSPRDQFAIVVAELGGLDRIRDREGARAAEDVLVAAGRRLVARSRPADTTALDGQDRYVMVIEGIRSISEAVEIAERALKELQRPFPTTHGDARIEARIGLVLGGPGYDEPESILADAIAAARRAAGSQRGIQVFDRTMEENHQMRARLRADLGAAFERNQFYLEYQPIVSLHNGRIKGLETFLRWRHPELGLVPPGDFLPVAADSMVIHDIGHWVLEQVCTQINAWSGHLGALDVPPVGINMTDRQLHAEGFLERVRDVLELHGIKSKQIRFDVREQDLMRDPQKAVQLLDRLHGMGIRVAIDDFGTGFSSLSLLHDLPVGALKIDRSFVSHPREKTREWGVARTIIELAKILSLDVIAEGIETREQFLALRRAGCTQAQGYHFSGPVGADAAEEMIRDGYPLDLEAPSR